MTNSICTVEGCSKSHHANGLCGTHNQRLRRYGSTELLPKQGPKEPCSVDGCFNPRQSLGLCVNHYMRLRVRGTTEDHVPAGIAHHSNGYLCVKRPGHPVANHRGWGYEHRMVLFDAIGPGSHPCHHCGATVTWGIDLETDHLDRNRVNNDPTNLVQTCHLCNIRRAQHRNQHSAPIDTSKDFAA